MSTKITLSEILNELEKHRGRVAPNRFIPNEEQKLFIAVAMLGEERVMYKKFIELWQKMGWKKISDSTLRRCINDNKEELTKLFNNYNKKRRKG